MSIKGDVQPSQTIEHLKDMVAVFQEKKKRTFPNIIPKDFRGISLDSLCTEKEKDKVQNAIKSKLKEKQVSSGDEGMKLQLVTSLDPNHLDICVKEAKFVSEIEADLTHLEQFLGLTLKISNREFEPYLQFYNSTSTVDANDTVQISEMVELYNLAYAIKVVASNISPWKLSLGKRKVNILERGNTADLILELLGEHTALKRQKVMKKNKAKKKSLNK